jgi:catechol 2,3-dioxygenase-like lactoylglutathione lyase family enzyme
MIIKIISRFLATTIFSWFLFVSSTFAELSPVNASGVTMGHMHYYVDDVDSEKNFWLALGGSEINSEIVSMVAFPGVIIMLSDVDTNERTEGTEGSVVNHIAFRVESLQELEQEGFDLEYNEEFPGIASVYSPSGERVELFDDNLATNIGFTLMDGYSDAMAERHNEPLTTPIVTHHLHFYLPAGQVDAAQNWYVENFAATPGQRWRYAAADLPGMNLNFSEADSNQAATQGRILDHIGFEVAGLEAFCAELESKGIRFDMPYRVLDSGVKIAFLTDPWGTRIELTEGLSQL